ncbi:MAG: hypothetical protein JXK93_04890 [Sphaerochaetaceae bacterium]|nr:hypothetical protein [Sphaerochaetaceae bacterium]
MKEKLLICDHSELLQCSDEIVTSPVECLDRALAESFDAVVVNFHGVRIGSRYVYLDLCAVLKQHGKCVVAIMQIPHREMLSQLQDSGVDYFLSIKNLDSQKISLEIPPLSRLQKLSAVYADMCPKINYSVDGTIERCSCAGAHDRLILSPYRIMELCATGNHTSCEFFIKEVKEKYGVKKED